MTRKAFVQEAEDGGEHIVVLLNEDGSRASTRKVASRVEADDVASNWRDGQTTVLTE